MIVETVFLPRQARDNHRAKRSKTTTLPIYAGGEDDRLALNMLEAKEGGKKKARRPRSDSTKRTPKIRVYGISDLHADFIENMEWLKDLPTTEYKNDVRICQTLSPFRFVDGCMHRATPGGGTITQGLLCVFCGLPLWFASFGFLL
eukprot:COSAG06_NODE_2368_length_6998_cov_3.945934_4_plen_146_part_00